MKRTKKQPFRNTISRIKRKEESLTKERAELLSMKQRVHVEVANAEQNNKTARKLLNTVYEREEKAKNFERFAREELERINNIHPSLGAELYIKDAIIGDRLTIDTVLNYRMSQPRMEWNDKKQVGAIKMVAGNAKTGRQEVIGYMLSERTIRDARPEMLDAITETIARDIARDLVDRALELLRK